MAASPEGLLAGCSYRHQGWWPLGATTTGPPRQSHHYRAIATGSPRWGHRDGATTMGSLRPGHYLSARQSGQSRRFSARAAGMWMLESFKEGAWVLPAARHHGGTCQELEGGEIERPFPPTGRISVPVMPAISGRACRMVACTSSRCSDASCASWLLHASVT